MKKELKYSNPFLKNMFVSDPLICRFFNCSSFNIFFKIEVTNNILCYFNFFVIGSFFVSLLLEEFVEKSLNQPIDTVRSSLSELRDNILNHKYFTNLDKTRCLNMVLFLENKLNKYAEKTN